MLVADYLAVHLFLYGALSLGLLFWLGVRIGRVAWLAAFALAAYGIFVFGGALDRYVASFMPSIARLPIIAAIAVGAIPYMLSDSLATDNGRASFLRVVDRARRLPRLARRGRGAEFPQAVLPDHHRPADRPVLRHLRPDGGMGRPTHDVSGRGRVWASA